MEPETRRASALGLEEPLRRTEAILRFWEEVDRRLAEHGLSGAAGAIESFSVLRRALEDLSHSELERGRCAAANLSEHFQQIAGELQRLRNLKSSLEERAVLS